jgi:hypothetical protein
MRNQYTKAEKRRHVKKAYDLVANGGTFAGYIALSGISRASLYLWKKQFGKELGAKEAQPLVELGKPAAHEVPMQRLVVSYCGATIEVTGEDALLALLKSIRAASIGLV